MHANPDGSMESWLSPSEMEAALRLLHAITILTRSFHNRRIYSYFGGLQTLMGVMKCKFELLHIRIEVGVDLFQLVCYVDLNSSV